MKAIIDIEESIQIKINKLVDKFGELKYNVIEHKVMNTLNYITYWDKSKLNNYKINILEQKVMISQLKDNTPFFTLTKQGYNDIITPNILDKDLREIVNQGVFGENIIWIKIEGIETIMQRCIFDYLSRKLVRYCLIKNLKLPETGMTPKHLDSFEAYIEKYFDKSELDYIKNTLN